MQIQFNPDEIADLVRAAVHSTLDEIDVARACLGGRLGYSESEAAALLGVKSCTLREMRQAGELRASRLGRRVIYAAEDLRDLLRRMRE